MSGLPALWVALGIALLSSVGGCSEPHEPEPESWLVEPEADPEQAAEEPGALLERRVKTLKRTRYFEECSIDESSYRAIERMRAKDVGVVPEPPPHCREFWALKRDYRLEYDCAQPEKPNTCAEYFARKERLGL